MPDRTYCTLMELALDLDEPGFKNQSEAFAKIRAASDWIDKRLGKFIPETATYRFDGSGNNHLMLERPLLSITTLTHDGDSITHTTQVLLYPRNKHYENGPYTRITIDPDATEISYFYDEEDIIVIAGSWGKYSKTASTGVTVTTEQSASATTLVVSKRGNISIGSVLLIDSEQELVTGYSGSGIDSGKNLAAACSVGDDTLTIETGHGINAGEIIRIDNEQMYVVEVVGATSLTVRRKWNDTTEAAHSNGADVYVYRTFTVKRAVNGTTAAIHTATTAISRYIPPWDVNYLCRQMAALMMKKSRTGYAGKTASLDIGEIFYHDEFPKHVYLEILENYVLRYDEC